MGQSQPGVPNDSSCFRACIRDKKAKTLQLPRVPLTPNFQRDNVCPVSLQVPKTPQKKNKEPLSIAKDLTTTRGGQTSLQYHLQKSVGNDGQIPPVLQKQSAQQGYDDSGNTLGLISKFSSSRKTALTKHHSPTKITIASEGLETESNYQKENGESSQTVGMSHGVSRESTRSRKVLLNKIQHLKQKYYRRELEIEIHQNENEYQEQLAKEKKRKQETAEERKEGGGKNREENARGKLLEKLNKRKMMRLQQKSKKKDDENVEENVCEELELFSREGSKPDFQKSGRKAQKCVELVVQQHRREDQLQIASKFLHQSQDISNNQRIQFSGYSQQDTLQEIRQCDQGEQDYKSKVESRIGNIGVRKVKVLSFQDR